MRDRPSFLVGFCVVTLFYQIFVYLSFLFCELSNFYCSTTRFFQVFLKKHLLFPRRCGIMILLSWRCIEVVITRTTRNRLVGKTARGFESHHLRHHETAPQAVRAAWSAVLFILPELPLGGQIQSPSPGIRTRETTQSSFPSAIAYRIATTQSETATTTLEITSTFIHSPPHRAERGALTS